MLIATLTFGWIGIGIFLLIVFSLRSLLKNNEYGFLHMLMAVMYSMWLPLPFFLTEILTYEALRIGMIFGLLYLIMMVVTMAMQTGHIVHIAREEKTASAHEERSNHIMATLCGPFELLANIFKCIWAFFLVLAFWDNDMKMFAGVMLIFVMFIFYFLILLVNNSLNKPLKLFEKVVSNPYVFNIETICFFLTIIIYITVQQ
ncbi:hypothetical protein D3H55_14050 [Bacillus salacetis]|uniref:Uncharacterized protein n=1 Tax=Bacillus salacetis TaxID=2315464 RepID=A0A3A1QV02_9BACI|nr:hypothetical protein [Bacillus salacetis]RIW32000.1 hypothetical protein D3H55_14050 [Bacillus salacetis]